MPQDHAKRPEFGTGSNPASGVSSPGAAALEGGTYFLGRYRVVDEIGIGGMASVHLARMDGPGGFQKWVAIKKIHSHLVEDESFVQMFLDEARVAARISHPNVATVFDLGKHDTTYWIAMEYLHGEPLREVMRRTEELGTAMPPEIACRVIADAAEGLHAAHELLGKNGEKLNLVHRDVTPHNLFVTYDGVTKVVDFGIAKFSSRQNQTRAGTLKGKLAYMSPEQVQGEAIDRRTDIFALGVVLWELTTGQRLFRMDSDIDTLARVQECNVPRPSTLIRGYPVDLERIVMKTLAKNRNERFRTARELSRALQSLLMRRGLFIASDEVASYTQSIFTDRIQKRDAHLRWASDVTQTINVDKLSLGARSGDVSGADPLPSAPSIPRVAPAAGAPVQQGGFQPAHTRPTTNRGGGGGGGGGPPRPAAGVPAAAEPHEARPTWVPDQEAPTTHDIPSMDDSGHMTPPTLLAAHEHEDEVATSVAILHDDEIEDDNETLVANAAAASAPHATIPAEHGKVPPYQGQIAYGAPPSTTGEMPYGAPASGPAPFGAGPAFDPAQAEMQAGYGPSGPPSGGYRRSGPPNRTEGRNQRTMLAQRFRRRPPLWMVAALSCSFALFAVGVAIAIYSTLNPKPRRPTGPITAVSAGPFTAARSAFTTWTATNAQPASTIVPPAAAPTAPASITPTNTAPTVSAAPTAVSPPPTVAAPTVAAPTPTVATPAPTNTPAPAPRTPAVAAAPAAPAAKSAPQKVGQGELTVVCIPKCDQIIDNGTPLGPGHIFKKPVAAGRHLLVLSAPNGVRKTLPVEVFPDKMSEVRLSMEKP